MYLDFNFVGGIKPPTPHTRLNPQQLTTLCLGWGITTNPALINLGDCKPRINELDDHTLTIRQIILALVVADDNCYSTLGRQSIITMRGSIVNLIIIIPCRRGATSIPGLPGMELFVLVKIGAGTMSAIFTGAVRTCVIEIQPSHAYIR